MLLFQFLLVLQTYYSRTSFVGIEKDEILGGLFSRMDEGEISFIGFDIGWISFFHDEEEKGKI